jgi:hypothetical protein
VAAGFHKFFQKVRKHFKMEGSKSTQKFVLFLKDIPDKSQFFLNNSEEIVKNAFHN